MVVTRKRSCSASEPGTATPGTPRAAKQRRQDEGVTARTTARCVDSNGTPAAAATTTPRRTRRLTDSVLDAAPPSPGPRPSRTRGALSSSSSQDARTPIKATQREQSSDGLEDIQGGRQLRVTLSDISKPSTPSSRSRRASGGEAGGLGAAGVAVAAKSVSSDSADVAGTPSTPLRRSRRLSSSGMDEAPADQGTPSTPLRRSRRLSSSGMDEAPADQGTPKQLTFSIARIIGEDGSKAKEDAGKKQSSLPVIKEDTEQADDDNTSLGSPQKDAKTCAAEEEKVNTKKPHPTSQAVCDKVEKPNSTKQTDDNTSLGSPQKDASTCAAEEEKVNTEKSHPALQAVCDKVEKPNLTKQTVSDAVSVIPNLPNALNTTEDGKGEKKGVIEATETSESDRQHRTISDGDNSESKSRKVEISSTEEEEQNNAISTSGATGMTPNPVIPSSPKDRHRTVPNGEVTSEPATMQDTLVTSSAPIDENGNKAFDDTNPLLPQVMAGDKKLLKVVPELKKKIEQIKSVPKGQPISGRWWKKEKQRFRSTNKVASGKKKWSKKMQLKQWREDVMTKSAAIEAEKQKKKDDLKERQKINKIRREENAKKAEIVQVIKDPRKIKKMKRKQLRYIETRDTTNLKQV